jgi:hypothetical protein
MFEVFKGDSQRIDLQFENDDKSVLNLSGCTIYFTAKRSFLEPDTEAIISISNSVHDNAVSGLSHINLSPTNTNQCPGVYACSFQLKDASSGITTFNTEQLSILPSARFIG